MSETSPKWTPIIVDRRSCISISPKVKAQANITSQTVLFMRVLGEILVFVPLPQFVKRDVANGDDRQKDAALALTLNEEWKDTPLMVDPPLFGSDTTQNKTSVPQERAEVVSAVPSHMSHVNKKGFIQIPDEVKDALGLSIGDNIIVDVRMTEEDEPIIVLKPILDKKKFEAFLQQKQKENGQMVIHTQQKKQMEIRLAQLQGEIEAAEQHLLNVKKTVKQQPPEGTPSRPLSFEQHVEKQQHDRFISKVAEKHPGEQVPTKNTTPYFIHQPQEQPMGVEPERDVRKEIPLAPGHQWTTSPFGLVQVPIMDD